MAGTQYLIILSHPSLFSPFSVKGHLVPSVNKGYLPWITVFLDSSLHFPHPAHCQVLAQPPVGLLSPSIRPAPWTKPLNWPPDSCSCLLLGHPHLAIRVVFKKGKSVSVLFPCSNPPVGSPCTQNKIQTPCLGGIMWFIPCPLTSSLSFLVLQPSFCFYNTSSSPHPGPWLALVSLSDTFWLSCSWRRLPLAWVPAVPPSQGLPWHPDLFSWRHRITVSCRVRPIKQETALRNERKL